MKRVAILTSGGDAPGMNACIRALVRYAIYSGFEVYGIERGFQGLVDNNIFQISQRGVSDIIQRGGTMLKSARCLEFHDPEVRAKAAANLKNRDIDSLVVIGGDGSFHGAMALEQEHGIKVVGIPGTIDNDLGYTDFTLGFDTAVNTVLSAINNLRDTTTSHDRACIVEVMGRNCGDIAVYAAVAGGAEHVLVPEIPWDEKEVGLKIRMATMRGKATNMIVFAEGAGDKTKLINEIKAVTGHTPTVTTLGHIQRGGTPTMADRILAAKFAVAAIDLLRNGHAQQVVGIKNNEIIYMDIVKALSVPRNDIKRLYEMAEILSI